MGCEMGKERPILQRMDTESMLALPTNFRSSDTRIKQDEIVDFISVNGSNTSASPVPSPCLSKHISSKSRPMSTYSSKSLPLWEDDSFSATSSSLGNNKSENEWKDVVWLRPYQLCSSPKLFVDGVSKNDVKQGILGDCWLLSACAAVAAHQNLLERVIEPQQPLSGPNYHGIINFRFWRFGDWIPISIDDRLPTRNGKLIFANCTNDEEFWLPLLEKAFAKMHGNYYALEGGHAEAAFASLTGGITERISIDQCTFRQLETIFQHGAFVTCSISEDSIEGSGLVRDHAYTVTAVTNLITTRQQNVNLVRVRSPWADHVEWTGDWSDRSDTWNYVKSDDRKKCNVQALHDGEFWISFDDFCKQFRELTIATLGPDFDQDGASDVHRQSEVIMGEWGESSAGGSRNDLEKFQTNPQYLLKVKETSTNAPTNFLIGLMQLPNSNSPLLPIAFFVYKTEMAAERLGAEFFLCVEEQDRSGDFTNSWQVVLRTSLEAADYIIIPATFLPQSHAKFILRVFGVEPFKLTTLDNFEANGKH